ncbi:shootin-1-like [Myiozetetes cayanensis]|uniref:shootin-1-like n=1 Tax=Myiozetetes cayanensis TaxID=478635 RepID=UPI00215E0D39|nr:shootin-1-like [Myiozetetes cayanensis]
MAGEGVGGHLAAILESGSSEEEEEEEEEEDAEAATGQLHPLPEPGDAEGRLAQLEQASQALLAELEALQMEVELEWLCPQRVQALTAQGDQENERLQRLSLARTAEEGTREGGTPGGGTPKKVPPEEKSPEGVTPEEDPNPAPRSGQQLPDLQEQLSRLLEQQEELTVQVQELQRQNQHLQAQLELEQEERQRLRAALATSQRALRSFKRVSQIVTQDYCEALEQLELEQDLRLHAEAFAHEMLVQQKEANRQSSILLRDGPDARLVAALQELGRLSRELEETRQEQRQRVEELQEQLRMRPEQEELDRAREALAEAEEQKLELRRRLEEAEGRLAGLEEEAGSLREKLAQDPLLQTRAPEPPPPPPLPPPGPAVPVDPLAAIRQRKGVAKRQHDNLGAEDVKAQDGRAQDGRAQDVRARAVQEMMERIRTGVVLRPAKDRAHLGQDPVAGKRRSVVLELQGILGAMRRPSRRRSGRRGSAKGRDRQLESILQRRRRALEAAVGTSVETPTGTSGGSSRDTSRASCSPPAQDQAGAVSRPDPGNTDTAPAGCPPEGRDGDRAPFRPRVGGGLPRTRPLSRPARGSGSPGLEQLPTALPKPPQPLPPSFSSSSHPPGLQ